MGIYQSQDPGDKGGVHLVRNFRVTRRREAANSE